MKKLIVAAVFGLAGLAAFAGTCTVTHISLVSTDGTHDTFAGQLDNASGVDILQHNFLVAFIDGSYNLVETKSVGGCLRSVQNNKTDFFSAVSTNAASGINVGLARIAFDSTFRVGTTSSQNVSITDVTANRSTTTLTVAGKVTNNASDTLFTPNACIVVRTSAGNVLITKVASMSDIAAAGNRTFSTTITVPNDSTASTVDIWVDGLDASNNPTTPQQHTGTAIGEGGTADHLSFTTQPGGNVARNINLNPMPVVKILDVNGDVVTSGSDSTLIVTLDVLASSAPAGMTVTCDDNTLAAVAGVAAFTNCKANHADDGTILTADTTGTPLINSNAFNINPGAAASIVFTTSPTGGTGGVAFPVQPKVSVLDANFDVVWSDNTTTITLIIGSSPGSLTCSPATNLKTVVLGVATFVGCAIDSATPGSYLHAIAAPALNSPTSATFNITVGAPATLTFTATPEGAGAGVLGAQPTVTIYDAGGNVATNSVLVPTITMTAGSGTLSGCHGTNVSGVVTYDSCSIDTVGTGKVLTATIPGPISVASPAFDI